VMVYDAHEGALLGLVYSVGIAEIKKQPVVFRLTNQAGVQEVIKATIDKEIEKLPDGSGMIYMVVVPKVKTKFGPGTLKVEAYLPKELGGDLWEGDIEVLDI
jgi:hypothetical protein